MMLDVQKLCKRYRVGDVVVSALEDISFSVERGAFLSIMGPSGSGKSTLLQILGLLDTPTEGHCLLEGQDTLYLPDHLQAKVRNRHFGFIFQSYNLMPELTAIENVELPLIYGKVHPRERRARSLQKLEQVGLGHRLKHLPGQLSGGEQQRVAIARALVTEPTLLLADEPTGNLSREGGRSILEILEKLNSEGVSMIVVTHDPEVGRIAPKTLHLEDGRLVDR